MIIDCISDLHGYLPEMIGGDLLIICGDMTARNKSGEWVKFYKWLEGLEYDKKIIIGGNHDGLLAQSLTSKECQNLIGDEDDLFDCEYIKDSGIVYKSLKIWGTPWTPWFKGINPECDSFMDCEEELKRKFDKIPRDTDILISHGPPFGLLDKNDQGICCGSRSLSDRVDHLNLKLHVFGHIHEGYGYSQDTCLSVNCSIMNERYNPVNKPVRIEVDECKNFTLKWDFY